jgi:adenine phosphoribosyltransferase
MGIKAAAVNLFGKVGAEVQGVACVIELIFLGGRERLDVPVTTLVSYDQ